MERRNKFGRSFKRGFKISNDLRRLTVDKCIEYGGNPEMITIPRGVYTKVAHDLKVSDNFVRKIWLQYCNDKTVDGKTASW